jgi:FkbM family methyltransferase
LSLKTYLRSIPAARRAHCYSFLFRYIGARLISQSSFAQGGEDILIRKIVPEVRFFIDIGANDGISGSNSFYFALRGASGVCFEPTSEPFRKLQSLYALRRDVVCRKIAVSDRDGETEIVAADYYSFLPETEDSAHSSVSKAWPLVTPKPEGVILKTFSHAIADVQVPATVDLLSLDVEGHELNVLSSIPFDEYRFRCIVVETHFEVEGKRIWQHRDLAAINDLLASFGYVSVTATRANTLYALGGGQFNI